MRKNELRKAVLPVGGLGTRFLPATKASPKEMLPIVDKPMIQYSVEEAKKCGINEFIVITGKNKRAIEDHFDIAYELEDTLKKRGSTKLLNDLEEFKSLKFAYIRQGEPLGLGHAILCSEPYIKDEPFAVLLGDDIIDPDESLLYDMIKIYKQYQSPVIALQEVKESEVSRYGIIKGEIVDNNGCSGVYKISGLIEKPKAQEAPSNLAVIGRYILTADIFDVMVNMRPGAGGEYQLTDSLNALVKEKPIYGFLFKGKRYDAGDKLGFLQATINLAIKRDEFSKELKEYIKSLSESF
ncbi:UTP--glucose-1-phosphate uridylyltransferase [Candidatus Magnetoovum chiemensis]|nr:UTP--glucose-1-phosphate uridylyltransferase [Candidatus Magnetoovum chiemensis]